LSELNPDCCHSSLITTPDGMHCPDCEYQWRAPYFLRAVIQKWSAAEAEEEAKRLKKLARKTVKDVAVGEEKGVTIAPAVAALFTDAQPELGKVWTCEACRRAPRRLAEFPNNWKWKTEKGFLNHKCLGKKEN